ncbi:hypothetical protein BMS3Abin13_01372 [bacterium BMS3Abin13]|nr:hypothetical protein BMS3Abin13_01372 [bacterium BMS3Abin13]
MKIAYLDCFSGISGDMLLGALLAAGLPELVLHDTVNGLGLAGCCLEISRQTAGSLAATRVRVQVTAPQPSRHLGDIKNILDHARLAETVRQESYAVFVRLARAEAAVHGVPAEEVHFHEVGALDALVDVAGVIAGLRHLGIRRLTCSPLPMPRGWVQCAHGELPLPAPAVCELLRGLPVYGEDIDQELVTPTGAALVREKAAGFGAMPPMRMQCTGYGAGSLERRDGRPNLLRLVIGTGYHAEEAQRIEVIETNLDDWNPETWPHVSERLMANGALDVSLVPVLMKKGRAGYLLRVCCEPARSPAVKETILVETSAIGLRFRTEQRLTLPRQPVMVRTRWGTVRAKRIDTPAGPVITPEYEDCRRLAREKNIPLKRVYEAVAAGNQKSETRNQKSDTGNRQPEP